MSSKKLSKATKALPAPAAKVLGNLFEFPKEQVTPTKKVPRDLVKETIESMDYDISKSLFNEDIPW